MYTCTRQCIRICFQIEKLAASFGFPLKMRERILKTSKMKGRGKKIDRAGIRYLRRSSAHPHSCGWATVAANCCRDSDFSKSTTTKNTQMSKQCSRCFWSIGVLETNNSTSSKHINNTQSLAAGATVATVRTCWTHSPLTHAAIVCLCLLGKCTNVTFRYQLPSFYSSQPLSNQSERTQSRRVLRRTRNEDVFLLLTKSG